MDRAAVERLLKDLKDGRVSVREAMDALRALPYEDLGFAKIDSHREIRRGIPEAVYCPGKTPEQVAAIVTRMVASRSVAVATRASPEVFARVKADLDHVPVTYHEKARLIVAGKTPPAKRGHVLVVTAGTSDIPVAEETAVTAEVLGNRVTRLYDVGVAGIHRVLDHRDLLQDAKVVVVVAGMEGALPSVVAGLVDVPVIAVPTSVGYGASFDGLAALLAMMNACSPGVAVVNIDNGFGAGYLASVMNR